MVSAVTRDSKELSYFLFFRVAAARLLVAGSGILLVIFFGRVYGVEVLGLFTIAQAFMITITVFSRCGLDVALTKLTAINNLKKAAHQCFNWAFKRVLIVSVSLSSLLFCLSYIIAGLYEIPELYDWLRIAALASVPFSLIAVFSGYLKGLQFPFAASFFENNGVCLLVLAGIFPFWFFEVKSSALVVMILFCACTWLLLAIAIWHVKLPFLGSITRSHGVERSLPHISELAEISKSTLPISFAAYIQSSVILLYCGYILNSEELGLLRASQQVGFAISFLLMVANAILPAKFAQLYNDGNLSSLSLFVRKVILFSIFLVTPPVVVCMIFPEWILGWFGPDFVSGVPLLRLILIGHFMNVTLGSLNALLVMTGYEKQMRNIALVCSLLGFAVCIFAVNLFGVIGAAASIVFVLVLQNLVCFYAVRKLLGFWPLRKC